MEKKKNGETSKTSVNGKGDNKIELLNCPRGGLLCRDHLQNINRVFLESNNYRHNKEYQLSIEMLKKAYHKTYELSESTCEKCARLFRTTIMDSLENLNTDLQRMSGSFLRGKRYQGSYLLSQKTLKELQRDK